MMCPVHECQAVVKQLHNHLTDFHKMKRGSVTYKNCLASVVRHEVLLISSSESTPDSSSSEEDKMVLCKKRKDEKRQKHESIFEKVQYTPAVKRTAQKIQ